MVEHSSLSERERPDSIKSDFFFSGKNFKKLLLPQNNIDYLMRICLRTNLPIIQKLGTETFHIINNILK